MEYYGHEAYLFLLRCLTENIDFRDQRNQRDQPKLQFLQQVSQSLPSVSGQHLDQFSVTISFLSRSNTRFRGDRCDRCHSQEAQRLGENSNFGTLIGAALEDIEGVNEEFLVRLPHPTYAQNTPSQ